MVTHVQLQTLDISSSGRHGPASHRKQIRPFAYVMPRQPHPPGVPTTGTTATAALTGCDVVTARSVRPAHFAPRRLQRGTRRPPHRRAVIVPMRQRVRQSVAVARRAPQCVVECARSHVVRARAFHRRIRAHSGERDSRGRSRHVTGDAVCALPARGPGAGTPTRLLQPARTERSHSARRSRFGDARCGWRGRGRPHAGCRMRDVGRLKHRRSTSL